MTQIPIFIDSRKAHLREAMAIAKHLHQHTEDTKKQQVKLIVKHLKEAIQSK